jgi:hypothetical protein
MVFTSTSYIPAPDRLPGFPLARRTEPKSQRRRWLDEGGHILEWDYQHGAVEMYDSRGRHLGEFDPDSGTRQKGPDRARRIEP